jgi:MFS family permease
MIACAAILVCAWGGNQFTPLLTLYRQHNGYSTTVVDVLLGFYVFGLAPALIVGHLASQRFGRVRVIVAALVIGLLASSAIALSTLPFLLFGRMLSGMSVGLGMAVGTSWVVELTTRAGNPPSLGARRAALSLTAGFLLGAGVAGVLAALAPGAEVTPYVVHIVVTFAVLVLVLTSFEQDAVAQHSTQVVNPFKLRSLRGQRFRRLVLPVAPWVFTAASVAFVIIPETMAGRIGHWSLLYATALTVVTLGTGLVIQPLARRFDHANYPRAILAALLLVSVGVATAALSVVARSPWLGVGAAVVLGLAFGFSLVAGLLELQRVSDSGELAAMTGYYYALAYLGFFMPVALAFGASWVSLSVELVIVAGIALLLSATVALWRPEPPEAADGLPDRSATNRETSEGGTSPTSPTRTIDEVR